MQRAWCQLRLNSYKLPFKLTSAVCQLAIWFIHDPVDRWPLKYCHLSINMIGWFRFCEECFTSVCLNTKFSALAFFLSTIKTILAITTTRRGHRFIHKSKKVFTLRQPHGHITIWMTTRVHSLGVRWAQQTGFTVSLRNLRSVYSSQHGICQPSQGEYGQITFNYLFDQCTCRCPDCLSTVRKLWNPELSEDVGMTESWGLVYEPLAVRAPTETNAIVGGYIYILGWVTRHNHIGPD